MSVPAGVRLAVGVLVGGRFVVGVPVGGRFVVGVLAGGRFVVGVAVCSDPGRQIVVRGSMLTLRLTAEDP